MTIPPDWIIPDWPAPRGVRALITTRSGGVSSGPYASCNLGLRTRDAPAAVAENRRRLRALLPQEPKWLTQVHGTRVVNADELTGMPQADASFSYRVGTVCAVLTADCMPLLLCDRDGSAVAIAHAGWRGLCGGVIEETISRMGIAADHLLAYMGPAIGPAAFEVGDDVRDAFVARDAAAAAALAPHRPGKWLADLYQLARQRLHHSGVTQIHGGGLCTYSDTTRFFSYRRERDSGRMASVIWREP
jgi:YfiH family protein